MPHKPINTVTQAPILTHLRSADFELRVQHEVRQRLINASRPIHQVMEMHSNVMLSLNELVSLTSFIGGIASVMRSAQDVRQALISLDYLGRLGSAFMHYHAAMTAANYDPGPIPQLFAELTNAVESIVMEKPEGLDLLRQFVDKHAGQYQKEALRIAGELPALGRRKGSTAESTDFIATRVLEIQSETGKTYEVCGRMLIEELQKRRDTLTNYEHIALGTLMENSNLGDYLRGVIKRQRKKMSSIRAYATHH